TVLQGGFGSGIGSATSGSGDMGGMMGLIGAMMGGMPMGMAGGGRNIGGGMPMGMTGMPFGMGSMGMHAAPKDDTVLYFCAVDVQVTEQGKGTISSAAALPVSPRQEMAAGAMPGAPVGDNKNNQMRVVAGVRQKKLRVEEATPVIREKLTTGIAGMF
ncbi:MAG: complement resistance protein TraT, partial [Nitrospiraceae bacterium]